MAFTCDASVHCSGRCQRQVFGANQFIAEVRMSASGIVCKCGPTAIVRPITSTSISSGSARLWEQPPGPREQPPRPPLVDGRNLPNPPEVSLDLLIEIEMRDMLERISGSVSPQDQPPSPPLVDGYILSNPPGLSLFLMTKALERQMEVDDALERFRRVVESVT